MMIFLQIFQNGFPRDFSILAVIRARQRFARASLFSIYNSESEESLIFYIGTEISLLYQDEVANEDNLISFNSSTNDLQWHRIAISVKGDSITLIFDCTMQITKKITRSASSRISTDGLLFMGIQLDEEEEYFTV
jgi:collagen type V/XI/XXIV/XXVII, alpha